MKIMERFKNVFGRKSKEAAASPEQIMYTEMQPHNLQRSKCKDCGGTSICEYNRQRRYCKDCGGTSIWGRV